MDNINACLGGIKRMDLFESARVDHRVPIEDAVRTLVQLKEEGKIGHIGLSECSAETLRRAHAVHPIAAVEIEVSLWSYEEEAKKGGCNARLKWMHVMLTGTLVIETAKELGVTVVAYS